ncbi:MAG: transcriptional regulator PpsR [Acetobacteraceae bacterium]|nr:transcriptional regulator PpsR [Acetobacteraceae bacterium]
MEDSGIRPPLNDAVKVAQPDVTLLLENDGIIRRATLFNAIAREGVQGWLGRAWEETVIGAGGESIRCMMEEARTLGVSGFGQVTQRFPSGLELPIEYTAVRLGGKAGLLAVGRHVLAVAEVQTRLIATQQAMERDHWKLRQVETRYQALFDASAEAVVVVDADTLRVIEANPTAVRATGVRAGENLLAQVAPPERESLRAMLTRARDQRKAPGQVLHFGPDRRAWAVRAATLMSDTGSAYLLQFDELRGFGAGSARTGQFSLHTLIERLPDGFVILDRSGTIRRANHAFLDLVQLGAEGAVIGEPLGRWLSRPGADAAVLLAALNRHGAARMFRTTIDGDLGAETEVEISAVTDRQGTPQFMAALIRPRGRDQARDHATAAAPPMPDLEFGTSLRDSVRKAIGSVERHHIMEALRQAEGNRTAAADLLGLSRQTLYAKLDRYGLNGSAPSDSGPPD